MDEDDYTLKKSSPAAMRFNRLVGWALYRPVRWFFWKMICNCTLRFKIERCEVGYMPTRYPNLHWWLLYKTVFKFFKWLNYYAWRVFCNWGGGYRRTFPPVARFVMWLGAVTAGSVISGGRCRHCGHADGDPVTLSEDEGEFFKLSDSGSYGTQDGTTHWFKGVCTCPRCGAETEYGDSN